MNEAWSRLRIVADHREESSGVPSALRGDPRVELRIARLACGDYEVDGQVLFERKTVPDFAQSLVDGRLFRQATRLASAGRRGAYVLEGTAGDLARVGVSRESLQGATVMLTLIFGLPLLRSRDPVETARLLVYTAGQLRRTTGGVLNRPGYRPRRRRTRQLYILQGLPGIGADRAARLLDHFGTVEAVVTADEKKLRSVRGIGKTTAARIAGIVREARAPYGAKQPSTQIPKHRNIRGSRQGAAGSGA